MSRKSPGLVSILGCFLLLLMAPGCGGGSIDTVQGQQSKTVITAKEGLNGPVASTATIEAAPVAANQQMSHVEAARFLAQASFGPIDVAEVDALRAAGFEAWIDHQLALQPTSSHLGYVSAQSPRETNGRPREAMAFESIWQSWLYSEAQLRARVAFALSQIFVVSNTAGDIHPTGLASYMDLLSRNAFGNYRALLEEATLHPAMGYFLNMIESEKEDPFNGTHPNENYAREVLQLFSIGLHHLEQDGTPSVDAQGDLIPAYDETVVQGFAKAFSGWSFGNRDPSEPREFSRGDEDWTVPMRAWASHHSTAAKTLLNGQVIPAGQTPQQDLQIALDAIFYHPNVAPFIARRLIQRLVTSNPSPAYVLRVASVFNANSQGARGDLGSVVTAILLDPEARAATTEQPANWGKQREPVIRLANMLRAMDARSGSGHSDISRLNSADNALGQSPLLAPSVFNFFSPDYRNPGAIAAAGLVSPEFQITTETAVVGTLNFFAKLIDSGGYGRDMNRLELNFDRLASVSTDAPALVERMNLMFMSGAMSADTRVAMMRAINSIDPSNYADRIKNALILTSIAPDFVIQR